MFLGVISASNANLAYTVSFSLPGGFFFVGGIILLVSRPKSD